jgi:hypothetical protein
MFQQQKVKPAKKLKVSAIDLSMIRSKGENTRPSGRNFSSARNFTLLFSVKQKNTSSPEFQTADI